MNVDDRVMKQVMGRDHLGTVVTTCASSRRCQVRWDKSQYVSFWMAWESLAKVNSPAPVMPLVVNPSTVVKFSTPEMTYKGISYYIHGNPETQAYCYSINETPSAELFSSVTRANIAARKAIELVHILGLGG